MKNERHVRIEAQSTVRSIQKQFNEWKKLIEVFRSNVQTTSAQALVELDSMSDLMPLEDLASKATIRTLLLKLQEMTKS